MGPPIPRFIQSETRELDVGVGLKYLSMLDLKQGLHCMLKTLIFPKSAETGTAMGPEKLRTYAQMAGFTKVEVLPVDNVFWRFYRLEPRPVIVQPCTLLVLSELSLLPGGSAEVVQCHQCQHRQCH